MMIASSRCWYYLILAIVLEIIGTGLLKYYTLQGRWDGYVYMLILISVSYYLLSLAVLRIPVSTAYASWEGLGLIGTTAVACGIFHESLGPQKLLAQVIIFCSLLLIKRGTSLQNKKE